MFIVTLIILLLICGLLIFLFINYKSVDNFKIIPKITKDTVWTYWEPSPPPKLVQKCYKNWKDIGKLKDIRFLSPDNITDYIPNSEYKKICKGAENLAVKSDFISFYLLYNFGGTWMDASIFVSKPLFEWLPRTDKFFAYRADRFNEHVTCIETFFMYSPKNHILPKLWYELLLDISHNEGKKDFIKKCKHIYPDICSSMDANYLWVYIVGKYLLLKYPEIQNEIITISAEEGPWYESEEHGWDNTQTVCKKLKDEGVCANCFLTKLHNVLRDECGEEIIPIKED